MEAIKEDIQWLGYQWGNIYYASDYFQQLWDFAIRLIEEGKAYIDEQTSEQIAAIRSSIGWLTIRTIVRARRGKRIRCTTSPTDRAISSRA